MYVQLNINNITYEEIFTGQILLADKSSPYPPDLKVMNFHYHQQRIPTIQSPGRQGNSSSENMHSYCRLVDCNKLQFFHKAFVTLLIMPLSAVRTNNGEQWFRERKQFCAKKEKINT